MIRLTLGTFNLQCTKANNSCAQAKLLKDNAVDICALQEINHDNYRFGSQRFDSMTGFVDGPYKFKDSYFAGAIEFAGGQMGVGVVSELPLQENASHRLYSQEAMPNAIADMHRYYDAYDPSCPQTVSDLERFSVSTVYAEPRVVTRSVVEITGHSLAFYSTHLSFESRELRYRQLTELKALLEGDPAEYVALAGDFNVDQSTKELDFLRDEFTLTNGGNGIWYDTFSGVDPAMNVNSVDNIILSKNMTVVEVRRVCNNLSDHDLFLATVELP